MKVGSLERVENIKAQGEIGHYTFSLVPTRMSLQLTYSHLHTRLKQTTFKIIVAKGDIVCNE